MPKIMLVIIMILLGFLIMFENEMEVATADDNHTKRIRND